MWGLLGEGMLCWTVSLCKPLITQRIKPDPLDLDIMKQESGGIWSPVTRAAVLSVRVDILQSAGQKQLKDVSKTQSAVKARVLTGQCSF